MTWVLALEHDGAPVARVPADEWDVASFAARVLVAGFGLPRVSVSQAVVEARRLAGLEATLFAGLEDVA